MNKRVQIIPKIPFILLVAISLVSGSLTGWFRLGFDLPVAKVFMHHGAIMTGSFLGTVILIERIVALKKKWLYGFPVINALSALFFFLNFNDLAFICIIIGAVGLFYIFYLINYIHSDLPHQIMWTGAAAFFIGNVHMHLFESYAYSVLWWMAFLLLTIAGERLELNRFLPVSKSKKLILVGFLGLFTVSCLIPYHLGGQYLTGASLLLTGLWLLRYDMIWKAIKMPGIHRYSAVVLLCGYIWLLICGIFYLTDITGFVSYDGLIHSFYLGFIFSMIFAHAPIILPGVLRVTVKPFHPVLYVMIGIFQLSLLMRVGGGLIEAMELKKWGGLVNGVVIFGFLITLVSVLAIQLRKSRI